MGSGEERAFKIAIIAIVQMHQSDVQRRARTNERHGNKGAEGEEIERKPGKAGERNVLHYPLFLLAIISSSEKLKSASLRVLSVFLLVVESEWDKAIDEIMDCLWSAHR